MRFIRNEWGTSMGIMKEGSHDPLEAMRMAFQASADPKEFINDYTLAVIEDGKYVPIPDASASRLKKEVCGR